MPSPRRKGIDYTPQFGAGIFRSKDLVEEERTALEQAGQGQSGGPAAPPAEDAAPLPPGVTDEDAGPLPPEVAAEVATLAPEQPIEQTKELASTQVDEEASMPANMLASYHDSLIADIRKVVKNPGREVAFVRVSPEEKGQLADIIYTYRRQGQKTSENEINRIAINFLLEDYRANGEQSILARTLAALRA